MPDSKRYRVVEFAWKPGSPTEMNKGARIIGHHCKPDGELVFYAIVDRRSSMVRRLLAAYGTGDPLPSGDPGKFTASVRFKNGLTLHFFDSGEQPLDG